MLTITIPAGIEQWDEINQMFIIPEEQTLRLEHSLVSLSKWESKWKKPFLTEEEKTYEESVDYIRCMTLTQNVDPDIYNHIPDSVLRQVKEYIDDPMTATTITYHGPTKAKRINGKQVTSELVYFWMIQLNIPSEYQKWHLNRLLTLIEVCKVETQSGKPMSKSETINNYAALNAARRQKMKSKG